MPSFDKLFYDSETDTNKSRILYKGKEVVRLDKLPTRTKCRIKIQLVTVNSEWRQGISLSVRGYLFVNGKQIKNSCGVWADTAPSEMTIDLESKDGVLEIYNRWENNNGVVEAWLGGAAMMIEEIPNGRRYYCNDGHPDDNFDDIVFEVTVLPENQQEI